MEYVSTRGNAPRLGFCDVLLTGLASDGGLYVPQAWPQLPPPWIREFAGKPYQEVALSVLTPFVGDEIERDVLAGMIQDAYSGFRHRAVAPLVQSGPNDWILELFHGPTLAFKDVAMQLLARLMDHVLAHRDQRATIVGATSGDTGGAAIEAFRGRERTDVFILFPKGKVSPVQQRQMTTAEDPNVHAIAIEGNFDDCQALVKAMFNHTGFREQVSLSGVNSINWARIMAQIVYYFSSASNLGAPERTVSFCVPTGNFGNIFAGYAAKKMGLPLDRLVIATNRNDILARTLETGRYEATGVSPTISPSMDIQVSSNFERLIFEACGRDDQTVTQLMAGHSQSGSFTLPSKCLEHIRTEFDAGRTGEAETVDEIGALLSDIGYIADPHTAVGSNVAANQQTGSPMITLSTAHPAKFPDAVEKATGQRPALPKWSSEILEREEKYVTLSNELAVVEEYILENGRAAQWNTAVSS
ncbi:MAG: threonine synthase [Rhizobiaceae bacterium]